MAPVLPTLTVIVYYSYYGFETEKEYVEELRVDLERLLLDGDELLRLNVPEGGIEGREVVLCRRPEGRHTSAEAWQVFFTWDVQRREDGTAVVVHPDRDYWRRYEDDYQAYRSRLEMEVPVFTQAVAAANQERIDEYGGRTAADDGYPMLVTDSNHLSQFLTDIGAYSHPDGPPALPAPPCGLAMPDQIDNPGLMRDCQALLAAKDHAAGYGHPQLERGHGHHRLGRRDH